MYSVTTLFNYFHFKMIRYSIFDRHILFNQTPKNKWCYQFATLSAMKKCPTRILLFWCGYLWFIREKFMTSFHYSHDVMSSPVCQHFFLPEIFCYWSVTSWLLEINFHWVFLMFHSLSWFHFSVFIYWSFSVV